MKFPAVKWQPTSIYQLPAEYASVKGSQQPRASRSQPPAAAAATEVKRPAPGTPRSKGDPKRPRPAPAAAPAAAPEPSPKRLKSVTTEQICSLLAKKLRVFAVPDQDPTLFSPDALQRDLVHLVNAASHGSGGALDEVVASPTFISFLAWQRAQQVKAEAALGTKPTTPMRNPPHPSHCAPLAREEAFPGIVTDPAVNPYLPHSSLPVLAILEGDGIHWEMRTPCLTIGRSKESPTALEEEGRADTLGITATQAAAVPTARWATISKCHCRILCDPSLAHFELLNYSQNGTMVDGVAVSDEPVPLRSGSTIELGGLLLSFSVAG